ncbi:MAG: NAD-dependent deacylase [Roseiflexaceae bacterium]|nr:NAD-dependent deacylase [Roseiflexaceae bacterium]
MQHEQIQAAAALVRDAQKIVALTGAGISTPSGVPDFRSDVGLWQQHNPFDIAALTAFRRDPQRFYRWFQPLLERLIVAQPNLAHCALAQLERAGRLHALVTQNIDGLHQRAGSREVYELHGNMRSATCLECDQQIPGAPVVAKARHGAALHCSCGGAYKPDIVLFEELLPRGLVWLAQRAFDTADLVIVAGTSLEVAPVCEMPLAALRRGAKLIIINHGETYLDARADVILRADVEQALPAIVEQVIIR